MSEFQLLGEMSYYEAKRVQAVLAERGVQIQLKAEMEDCGKGCAPKVKVFAMPEDFPQIQELFRAERARDLGGLDATHADSVFDTEQETANCPACGTAFSTRLQECPDCGLCFSTEPAPDPMAGNDSGD